MGFLRTNDLSEVKIGEFGLDFKVVIKTGGWWFACETLRKSNFLKNGKIVISVKIRKFSRSRMTKRTFPLKSSREIW